MPSQMKSFPKSDLQKKKIGLLYGNAVHYLLSSIEVVNEKSMSSKRQHGEKSRWGGCATSSLNPECVLCRGDHTLVWPGNGSLEDLSFRAESSRSAALILSEGASRPKDSYRQQVSGPVGGRGKAGYPPSLPRALSPCLLVDVHCHSSLRPNHKGREGILQPEPSPASGRPYSGELEDFSSRHKPPRMVYRSIAALAPGHRKAIDSGMEEE